MGYGAFLYNLPKGLQSICYATGLKKIEIVLDLKRHCRSIWHQDAHLTTTGSAVLADPVT